MADPDELDLARRRLDHALDQINQVRRERGLAPLEAWDMAGWMAANAAERYRQYEEQRDALVAVIVRLDQIEAHLRGLFGTEKAPRPGPQAVPGPTVGADPTV